jgi:hypothetical protein
MEVRESEDQMEVRESEDQMEVTVIERKDRG